MSQESGGGKSNTLISCSVCVNLDGQCGMRMGMLWGKHVSVCSRGTVIYFFPCLFFSPSAGLREWVRMREKARGEINSKTALSDRSIVSELRWLSAVVMCWLLFAIVLLSRHFSFLSSSCDWSPLSEFPRCCFFFFSSSKFKLGKEGEKDQVHAEM